MPYNKKLIFIILGILILGLALYFAYNRLVKPKIIQKQQKIGLEIWENALKKEEQSFHYSINNIAKSGDKEVYTQIYTGDWIKDGEIQGTYEFKNSEESIRKEFISLKNVTYSKEANSQKWFIWQTKDYPELVYYVPSSILKSVDKDHINLVQNKDNLYTFDCIFPFQSNSYVPSAGPLLITLNKTGDVVGMEYERTTSDINVMTKVDYSSHGESKEIKAPQTEDIIR